MSNIDFSKKVTVANLIEQQRSAAQLDRFEFAVAVAQHPDIAVSFEEAAQWAAGNAIPAPIQAILDQVPNEQQRGAMIVDVLARPVIRRNGDLMPAIAAAYNVGDDVLDDLFGVGEVVPAEPV